MKTVDNKHSPKLMGEKNSIQGRLEAAAIFDILCYVREI